MKARPAVPAPLRIHFDLTTVRLFIATAYDIVGQGTAQATTMTSAFDLACRMGASRRACQTSAA